MIDRNPFSDDFFDSTEEVQVEDAPSIPEAAEPKREPAPAALQPGISRLPSADYHSDPAPLPSLSATLAKILLKQSPRHAWFASPRLNPNHEPVHKKTFSIGRAAHRAVLGFGDDYVRIPKELLAKNGAVSTNAAKDWVETERKAGRTPLVDSDVDEIESMAEIASVRLAEHGITLDPARSELSAIVEIDGIWCRTMFDNVDIRPTHPIYDFKTCEDASPAACLRAILNYGYDVQAEHYIAVWKAATGEDRPFVFLFQEKAAPYEVTLVRLSGSFRELAQRRAAKARSIWAECVTTNNWPGYPVGMHEVDPPAWLIERELAEAI